MKQSNKITNTLKALTLAVLAMTSKPMLSYAAGTAGGGGGYAYIETAYKHLDKAQEALLENLSGTNQSDLDYYARYYKVDKIEKKRLMHIVSTLAKASLVSGTRVVDGFKQPLDMNYSVEGQNIVALDRLFAKIDKVELTGDEFKELQRKILHEASHLFNIGVANDKDSVGFSSGLLDYIQGNAIYNCGVEGSVEDRIASCKDKSEHTRVISPVSLKLVNNTISIDQHNGTIYDAREKLGVYVWSNTYFVYGSNLKPKNLSEFCQKNADDINGKIQWVPATAEQVAQLVPEPSFDMSNIVMIGNDTVRYTDRGIFGAKAKEGSIKKFQKDSEYRISQSFVCVGTEK